MFDDIPYCSHVISHEAHDFICDLCDEHLPVSSDKFCQHTQKEHLYFCEDLQVVGVCPQKSKEEREVYWKK